MIDPPTAGHDVGRAAAGHWQVIAEPTQVGRVRRAVVAYAERAGMPEERLYDVGLAVSEALTNVVVHAYRDRPGTGEICVEARRVGGDLEVVVADDGLGMAPRIDSPGLGLGVPVIAMLSRSHTFTARESGRGTRLTMVFVIEDERAAA